MYTDTRVHSETSGQTMHLRSGITAHRGEDNKGPIHQTQSPERERERTSKLTTLTKTI